MPLNSALLDLLDRRAALVPDAEDPRVLPVPALPSLDPQAPQFAVPSPPPAPPAPAYGPGADKAALDQAIQSRGDQDRSASLLDAASLFNRAGGGHAGDLAAGVRAHRDDAVQDVLRQRALVDQDAAAKKRQREEALTEALQRADSPETLRIKDLFGATAVGQALRERLGEDQWSRLSGANIPGSRDMLASETDLLKAGLKSGHPDQDRAATLEALVAAAGGPATERGAKFAQMFANAPANVIREQGFQLLNHDEQRTFQQHENEKARTAAFGRFGVNETNEQENKRKARLQDIGNTIKPELASGVAALNQFEQKVAELGKKYGEDNIPGTGLVHQWISRHPTLAAWTQSDEANEFQGLGRLLEVFGRKDITGSAFSKREEEQIRGLLNNITNGASVRQSIGRLKLLVNSAVNRVYAAHPDVWREYAKANPALQTPEFNLKTPVAPNEAQKAAVPLTPEQLAAMGVNPALAPNLPNPPRVEPQPVVPPPESAPQVSPKDDQMAQWAVKTLAQNPHDPDALAVKAKLERKGFRLDVKQ
jgi:hypothetical protein